MMTIVLQSAKTNEYRQLRLAVEVRRCLIRLQGCVGVPAHLVAYSDRAGSEYFRIGAAAPTLPHRSLKSWGGLLHLLARAGLSPDAKARGSDAEHPSAAVFEVDVGERPGLRASRRGLDWPPTWFMSSSHRSSETSVTWRRPPRSALPLRPIPGNSSALS